MNEPTNTIKRYPTFATRLFDLIETEHPDYYDLPVKERNEIMKEVSQRIVKEINYANT